MAKPKLSTKTPDDPVTNSLIDQHGEIIQRPNERRIALVELASPETKRKNATGEEQATVQIVHLELLHGADAVAGEKLFSSVHKARTGNNTRPAPDVSIPDTPLEGLGADVDDSV